MGPDHQHEQEEEQPDEGSPSRSLQSGKKLQL